MTGGFAEPLPVLLFSSLYPNAAQTRLGVFVENRALALADRHPVDLEAVVPVPWFPLYVPGMTAYSEFAAVPRRAQRGGIPIHYPRYPVIPKVSWRFSPWLLYRATRGLVHALHRRSGFAVIDAHFFYPDGVAAVMLGRELGVPVCITARGSDINTMPSYRFPGRFIRWAIERADGLVAVSSALRERLVALGAPEDKVEVIRNGVDSGRFHLQDRAACRARLELAGPVLLCVGNLVPLKRHDIAIEIAAAIENATLLIVGRGPERARLQALAAERGVAERVRFVGEVAQDALPDYYGAADLLVLTSEREGLPNVLIEAMSCGTPVVASRVGGTPEVVRDPAVGRLVAVGDSGGFVEACRALLAAPPPAATVQGHVADFTWGRCSDAQFALLNRLVARGGVSRTARSAGRSAGG